VDDSRDACDISGGLLLAKPLLVDVVEDASFDVAENDALSTFSKIRDPWCGVSDDVAYEYVQNEQWDVICVSDHSKLEASNVSVAHVVADCTDVDEFVLNSATFETVAVSLDFADKGIQHVSVLRRLWLRSLNLSSNPLVCLDGLCDLFPHLLVLELSFVDFSSIPHVWVALEQCTRLRALTAEGSCVETLIDMRPMPSLQRLELMDNGIESLTELETLVVQVPALVELDLRENAIADEYGYLPAVRKQLPRLVCHDSHSLKQCSLPRPGMVLPLSASTGYSIDAQFVNEHCSCVEGNPCTSPEVCFDWINREQVAARARKKKGLRDVDGRLL